MELSEFGGGSLESIICPACGRLSKVDFTLSKDAVCPACGAHLWISSLISRFSQFSYVPDYQVAKMLATSRDGAINELAQVLAKGLGWSEEEQERLVGNVIRREELGSTAIGHGFAIPHAAVDWGDFCVSVLGFVPEGINFEALDGKPVHTIILIAYSSTRRNEQIRLLERVSRAMRSAA